MQSSIDELVNASIQAGEISAGVSPSRLRARGLTVSTPTVRSTAPSENRWSLAELDYVRQNCGYMTYADMAAAIGRTAIALEVRCHRMGLPSPGRNPALISRRAFCDMLGVSGHVVNGITQRGEIPIERNLTPLGYVQLIRLDDVWEWLKKLDSHVLINLDKCDPRVREIVLRAQQEQGDRYVDTVEAARLYEERTGVKIDQADIHRRVVKFGDVPYIRKPNQSGRHKQPTWSRIWILASDVAKLNIKKMKTRQN